MERRAGTGLRRRIGDILVEGAFVSREQLNKALEISQRTGKRVGEVLVDEHYITPETLTTVLSFQLNVPVIDLKQFKIDPEAPRLIPESVAREHNVLPLAVDGDTLRVAMEEPQDLQLIDMLSSLTRKTIRPVLPLAGGLKDVINANYKLTTRLAQEMEPSAEAAPGAPPAAARPAPTPLLEPEAVAQAPVVRALDMIITQAVRDRASDIHIVPKADDLKVSYRIDGVLHEAVTLPKGVHSALLSRVKVLASMNIAERRRPQDGQFSTQVGDKEIDFRVATVETSHGEMAVLRVLDKSVSVLKISDIGFQPASLRAYQNLLNAPFGMVLVSGPTGSGKTTTLYASINELQSRGQNIMTIEDPVEYHFPSIQQIQVNRAADITFPIGLRAIMRLDPDIILVGEIRDAETANVAVQAALTGHLVLTSIHANDAAGAIVRLIDLGVEPFLVTSAVIGTVAQRLVRKTCPYCKTVVAMPPNETLAYQQEMGETRTDFHIGRGCNFCSQTGFLGRVGVFEVMAMSDHLRQIVGRGGTSGELKEQAIKDGMVPLRRDGMLKAKDGITTPGEVLRHVFIIG